jgi:hypothetical protein
MDETQICERLSREGYNPRRVAEPPGAIYENHRNAHDMLLAFVTGSADVRIGRDLYHCVGGDRLNIPGDIEHSATIGADGVVYFMTQVVNEGD